MTAKHGLGISLVTQVREQAGRICNTVLYYTYVPSGTDRDAYASLGSLSTSVAFGVQTSGSSHFPHAQGTAASSADATSSAVAAAHGDDAAQEGKEEDPK